MPFPTFIPIPTKDPQKLLIHNTIFQSFDIIQILFNKIYTIDKWFVDMATYEIQTHPH